MADSQQELEFDDYLYIDYGNSTYEDYFQEEHYLELDVQEVIHTYIIPIIIIIGLVGNGVVVVVMWRMASQVMPLCVYCVINAILNSFVLVLESGTKWLARITRSDMINDAISKSETSCKVYAFIKHLSLNMDSWIVVVIMMEAVRTIWNPKRLVGMKVKYVMDVFVFIVTLLVCFNTHYFWTFGLVDIHLDFGMGTNRYVYDRKYCTFLTRTINGQNQAGNGMVYALVHGILADVIPSLMVAATLVVIGWASRSRRGMFGRPDWKDNLINADAAHDLVVRSFLVIGIGYLSCNVPHMAYEFSKFSIGDQTPSALTHARIVLLEAILRMWREVYHSFKVFMYCITCLQFRKTTVLTFRRFVRWLPNPAPYFRLRVDRGVTSPDTTRESLVRPSTLV